MKWRPTSEKPKDPRAYIVYVELVTSGARRVRFSFWRIGLGWMIESTSKILAWMPLPDPPQDSDYAVEKDRQEDP